MFDRSLNKLHVLYSITGYVPVHSTMKVLVPFLVFTLLSTGGIGIASSGVISKGSPPNFASNIQRIWENYLTPHSLWNH